MYKSLNKSFKLTGVPRSPCFNKLDQFYEYTQILEQPFLAYKYNVKDEK